MAGKRKRDTAVVSRSTAEEDEEPTPAVPDTSSHDVFRKFFEAQFQPLDLPGGAVGRDEQEEEDKEEDSSEDDGSESGSEWGGVSDENEDEDNKVEVVEHQDSKTTRPVDKKARKEFMTAKPPSFSEKPPTVKRSTTKDEGDDDDNALDADNLKNDLALQRLLKESHLLDSASDLAPTGKNRLKALDLRMQELGAKSSLYYQKMPTAHRRGIKAKAEKKDDKRRKEAKENGIILEKPAPKAKANNGRRERGVGGPSVGKFAGGSLNLSKRDIMSVQGKGGSSRGKSKGRR